MDNCTQPFDFFMNIHIFKKKILEFVYFIVSILYESERIFCNLNNICFEKYIYATLFYFQKKTGICTIMLLKIFYNATYVNFDDMKHYK